MPVVQLSINAYKPLEYHLELGAKLAPLRERGVLIVGSGNVVHNLGAMDPSLPDGGFGWAQRFDDAARRRFSTIPPPSSVFRNTATTGRRCRRPTTSFRCCTSPDWPRPMRVRAGVLTDGYAYGSLSMTSYTLGL